MIRPIRPLALVVMLAASTTGLVMGQDRTHEFDAQRQSEPSRGERPAAGVPTEVVTIESIGAAINAAADNNQRTIGYVVHQGETLMAYLAQRAAAEAAAARARVDAARRAADRAVVRSDQLGSWPSEAWILRLARCEQPGNGWQGVNWSSRGGYPGGVGFLPGAWTSVKNPEWPASMADAEPWMQIEAVRRLGAREGFTTRVWGCIATIGGPY